MTKEDAKIIIAEIDRLYQVNLGFKKEYRFHPFKRIVVGRLQALEGLKSFISSLPTEKEPSCQTCTNDKGCVTCKNGELWEGKEQPSEDLKKYASRAGFDYVDDIDSKYPGHIWNDHDVEFAYRDGIIEGAEWQKEQMLKEAVEGKVVELGETYKDLSISVKAKELNEVLQPLGLKDGDKVKIVIVKED